MGAAGLGETSVFHSACVLTNSSPDRQAKVGDLFGHPQGVQATEVDS